MRTAVVILNWNTEEYLRAFLPGVIASCRGIADVVVADNASTDASRDVLREEFPSVKTILLDRNYGFTGGYNKALGQLDNYDYFVLLNSDIDVPQGWLEPLVDWMDKHPDCGICGPKLHGLLRGADGAGGNGAPEGYIRSDSFEYAGAAGGKLDRFGFPFCRGRVMGRVAEDRGQYDTPAEVLWITGACLMIRSLVWKELDGLDDRFFAHCEEIDLCWRAQLSGWKVCVVPQSTVWHLGGGTLPQNSPRKLYLNYRNNLLMLDNNLLHTYIAEGYTLAKAAKKSARMLGIRMLIDNLAKFAYICSGRADYAKAVSEAHRDYRKLRTDAPQRSYKGAAEISGLSSSAMIISSFLYGKRVLDKDL